jgi:D-alanyl-D-alanine carboxypeptidase (penicillin-binding protein 5/6)
MERKNLFNRKIFLFLSLVLGFTFFASTFLTGAKVLAQSVNTQDKSSIIIEYESGKVVYENNADEKLQVASIVKLMTTLLTIEEIEKGNLKLDDKLTSTENAASMGGSQVFIDPFVQYKIEDMLKSVIVASANDAAVALAEHIAGSETGFVKRMNKRATELGMTNTIYANSTGLPAPEEYSTARDTAIILKEIISHKTYHNYSTIWMDELVHSSGRKTEVVNTNKLSRYYKGCDSGKTGFTDEAGYCLTASAQRDSLRFIAVSLGAKNSKTRFANVSNLLNYAFANFENTKVIDADSPLCQLDVKMGKQNKAEIYAEQSYYALNQKGEQTKYELSYSHPKSLKAPLKSGQKVGVVTITSEGKIIAEINLIVKDDLQKLTYKDAVNKVFENWA